jgi:hypothetical protein
MSRQLSVGSILAELQERMDHHHSREVFHAQQEAFHQEQRAHHAAELQMVRERFEAFQAAADAAGELVARPREVKAVDDSIPAGKGAVLSKLVARVVAARGPLERFGANDVAREIRERYGSRLNRKIDPRSVAAKLRRMAQAGMIHCVRPGRALYEALYTKSPAGM